MYIGAAYYPELWDENEIEQDITRCKEAGVNCLRIGEFAWGKMEKAEGSYDFSFFERVVDRLYTAGIYTVMCTPTCTPPRWFLEKYEETRSVYQDGRRQEVSSRCHPCKTSPIMRAKNREIVTEMAKVFGSHKGIVGWQIDNELLDYGGGCFCELCVGAFREYLKKKYVTVEALNEAWGMSRWSLDYPAFEYVLPPRKEQWRHPSLRTEWRRFQNEQICTYIDEQAEILRRYTDAPIGTDMMPMNTLSYYRATKNLDVVQFNHYDSAEMLYRKAFDYDFLRPIKERPFWVTETQVGWNGSEYAANGYRPEGNCYMNTWMPVAMGAEANMYWLFRAHRAGHELAHGALFSACGRAYRVTEEVKKASDEIMECRDFLENSRIRSEIAIHYSSVSEHNFLSAPILENFRYRSYLDKKVYQAFKNCNVDIIDVEHSLDGYKTLISPFLSAIDGDTADRIRHWIEDGGIWIVGPMSDIMTDYTARPTHAPFFFLEELAGVYTKCHWTVRNSRLNGRTVKLLSFRAALTHMSRRTAKVLPSTTAESLAGIPL